MEPRFHGGDLALVRYCRGSTRSATSPRIDSSLSVVWWCCTGSSRSTTVTTRSRATTTTSSIRSSPPAPELAPAGCGCRAPARRTRTHSRSTTRSSTCDRVRTARAVPARGASDSQRRRGRRQRKGPTAPGRVGPTIMKLRARKPTQRAPVNLGALLAASAVAVSALSRDSPSSRSSSRQPTSRRVHTTALHATGPASPTAPASRRGPVYPERHHQDRRPGLPVDRPPPRPPHRLPRSTGDAPTDASPGTEEVVLKLTGPERLAAAAFVLAPQTRFDGRLTPRTDVTLDLQAAAEPTMAKIARLTTGSDTFGGLLVWPYGRSGARRRERFAGQPLNTAVAPGTHVPSCRGRASPTSWAARRPRPVARPARAASQASYTPTRRRERLQPHHDAEHPSRHSASRPDRAAALDRGHRTGAPRPPRCTSTCASAASRSRRHSASGPNTAT